MLLIGSIGTNLSEIKIQHFSFTKMRLKISSAKCRPSCRGLNVLTHIIHIRSIYKSKTENKLESNELIPECSYSTVTYVIVNYCMICVIYYRFQLYPPFQQWTLERRNNWWDHIIQEVLDHAVSWCYRAENGGCPFPWTLWSALWLWASLSGIWSNDHN